MSYTNSYSLFLDGSVGQYNIFPDMCFAARARRVALALIVCVCAPSLAIGSLDPARSMHQYVLETWQAQDGLPQSVIRAVVQTRDGYLWLGTPAGVVRFDGVEFKNFGRRAFPELPSDFVEALVEGSDGGLWAGFANGGVHRLREGVWQSFGEAEGLSRLSIATLLTASDGTIWVGASRGLFTIEDGLVEECPLDELRNARVEQIVEDHAGRIWVAAQDAGIFRIGEDGARRIDMRDGLPDEHVSALLVNPDGSVWAGTEMGNLALIREDGVIHVQRVETVPYPVNTLLRDGVGTIWVGTMGGGLGRLLDEGTSTFGQRDGLVDRRVWDILEDLEGNLWVGTYGGLVRIKNARLTSHGVKEGLADDFVWSIYEADNDDLWVASSTGIARRRGEVFEVPSWFPTDGWPRIRSVLQDRSGALWVGTEGGLFRYHDGAWLRLGTRDGLPGPLVHALFEDSGGVLWVGTHRGPRRWNGRRLVLPGGAEALDNLTAATAFHEDRTGVLWIGTGAGLFARRHDTFEPVPFGNYPNATVRNIYEDEEGTLWFGTMAGGLLRYHEGHFTRYTLNEGFPDDSVWMVLESRASPAAEVTMWMCSDIGIFSVPKRELEALAAGTIARLSTRRYGISDGMKNLECNGLAQPSGLRSRDGHLWFPTAGGAVEIDPEVALAEKDYVSPVVIHEVLVNDTPTKTAGGFTLAGGNNDVEFRFAALDYTEPERVRFRYRLGGYDADWIDGGTRRWAHYANLPPGEYRFSVNAGTAGRWNEPVASVTFVQRPRWYQETWFLAASGLMMVVLLLGGFRFKVERLKRQRKELEKRVLDRSAAEESQRRAKEHLLSIYDNATFGIFSGTKDGSLLDVNPALVQMLGYGSAEELLAADRLAVYPKADRHTELIDASTKGDTFKDVEVEWRAKDGSPIAVRLNGRALPREVPPVYVTIAEDITGERALEEQLRQTQKMEAVGRLAGGVAHDFNNLLTVIIGYADRLLHKAGAGDSERSETRAILSAAERAAALTSQLLAFSRKHPTKPRVVQLNEIISKLEPMLVRLIGADHVVTMDLEKLLDPILADRGHLEQVLVNLMLNARDAMPGGGQIVVRTRNREVDADDDSGARPGHYVALTVSDTGVGMDEETRRRLFEPFFTTKPTGKGTGLGLYLVYGTVRQAGGYVSVNSRPGRGAVFEILLPCTEWVPEETSSSPAKESAKACGDKTILVVEDEASVRGIVVETLERAGYDVLIAPHPERAVEISRVHDGPIDFLVTDLVMPGMKGTQLADLLSKERPDLQVLFISGYADGVLARDQVVRESERISREAVHAGRARRARRRRPRGWESSEQIVHHGSDVCID